MSRTFNNGDIGNTPQCEGESPLEKSQKILLVDHREQNIIGLEKILKRTKAELIKAVSSNDALKTSLKHEFALAILEVPMPDMDGCKLAELLHGEKKNRRLPIIFMSEIYSDDYHMFKGCEAGAVDFIVKPYHPEILLSKVNVFLRLDKQKKELLHLMEVEARTSASLKEKEVMLKEVHHRVKNNLQVVGSMLSLQSNYIHDREALDVLRKSQDRIRTIALVHDKLYHSNDPASIDFAVYARELAQYLLDTYQSLTGMVEIEVDMEDVAICINTAVLGGLILNELVTNALKHAFSGKRQGRIRIELRVRDERLILTVSDNGPGLPKDLDFKNPKSLGLRLLNTFVEQLNGVLEIDTGAGTQIKTIFPVNIKNESAGSR